MEHMQTGDIGGRLRRARESRGLSLADVARQTKHSISVVQAIERNDFSSLPGGMFRKAYLRTLAAEVGLNPQEIATEYSQRFEPAVETVAVPNHDAALQQKWLQQLTPAPRRSIVGLAAIGVPALAWFMMQPAGVASTVPRDYAANELAATPISQGASIALTSDTTGGAATPAAMGARAAAPLRVEIAATGWCWVAADTDGERVLYRLIEPGERVVLDGQQRIALRLGDAGSVTVSINDGPSRSLGREGQVVELEVTPDNVDGLRDGAARTASGA